MRVLRWIGIVLLVVLGVLVAVGAAARFSDGPLAVFPGGPLEAGELVSEPVADWSFATDVEEIEFALLAPPRSRTVWIVVHEGEAYIPCGFLDVPLWKQWPHEAEADGRAVVRIEGKRYETRLSRVTDPALLPALGRLVSEKYTGGREVEPGSAWFFRLDPRGG
jgi:hypothetical protein